MNSRKIIFIGVGTIIIVGVCIGLGSLLFNGTLPASSSPSQQSPLPTNGVPNSNCKRRNYAHVGTQRKMREQQESARQAQDKMEENRVILMENNSKIIASTLHLGTPIKNLNWSMDDRMVHIYSVPDYFAPSLFYIRLVNVNVNSVMYKNAELNLFVEDALKANVAQTKDGLISFDNNAFFADIYTKKNQTFVTLTKYFKRESSEVTQDFKSIIIEVTRIIESIRQIFSSEKGNDFVIIRHYKTIYLVVINAEGSSKRVIKLRMYPEDMAVCMQYLLFRWFFDAHQIQDALLQNN